MRNWAQTIAERLLPHLSALLDEGPLRELPSAPGAAEAAMAWSLALGTGRPVALVCDGAQSLETRRRDLLSLCPGGGAGLLYFPAWEELPRPGASPDPEIAGHRMAALDALRGTAGEGPLVLATCVQALMQKTVTRRELETHGLSLAVGDELDPEEVARQLLASGYADEPEVVEKGRVTRKGGLLDVWPITQAWPLRVEFFGTSVESIRTFDPGSQRSVSRIAATRIPPADEWLIMRRDPGGTVPLLDHLPDDTVFLWSEFDNIRDHAALYTGSAIESGAPGLVIPLQEVEVRLKRRRRASQVRCGASAFADDVERPGLGLSPLPGVVDIPRDALQPDVLEEARRRLLADLQARAAGGYTVVFFFDTEASLAHFREHLGEAEPRNRAAAAVPAPDPFESERCHAAVGALSEGFVCETASLVVVAEADLYGRRREGGWRTHATAARRRAVRAAGSRVSSLTDIEPGDLVVHVQHGLGKYLGMCEITFNGMRQEVLTVEYDEEAKLHVPLSHAHLLSRYVGVGKHAPRLHRLGGRRWTREKADAEAAIMDMAAALLDTQAQRELLEGHVFPPDAPWQHEFEAAFAYQETADQEKVIRAVKRQMESQRPMDLLVCGDAGYGKTEVAMRAAFKAVMGQKQAAVLVPTTVLAQQHYETFSRRMSAYPVRIEMLSRFQTRKRRSEILKGLDDGAVDIVIGTHALLQPGISFRDLGLVIIDEEQRFGVAHKERLKHMRRLVDVLTLTATPIPRTLYMSMTGARDMSLLQTPPVDRMAIETLVTRNTDRVVRDALLRELNREGQAFYLHNRVMTIERVRRRLARLVPEARIAVAHGQMPSAELAATMRRFAAGEFEVLVCTTIIESGLDIPRANTIIIDRADRFGIADLYQLRGRVGRSRHKAYAYLLLPAHGQVDSDARKRIGAVRTHSGLTVGFQLALRDLEIRGAGNLLGTAQSGHITAIGFGLYCQLLKRTVAQLKGEAAPPVVDVELKIDFLTLSPSASGPERAAVIPYAYLEDERLRIGIYRKMAEASRAEDVRALRDELRDRFGPSPAPVERLLRLAELRICCARQGITRVEARDGKAIFMKGRQPVMQGTRFPRLHAGDCNGALEQLIELAATVDDWGVL